MNHRFHITVLLLLNILLLSSILCLAQEQDQENNTLYVIGFTNEVEDTSWRDARIGMGVRALLSQELSNTGKFRLLEEKDEIRQKIRDFSDSLWTMGADGDPEAMARSEAENYDARYIAYGRIYYYGVAQSGFSGGGFHSKTVTTIIKLEVVLMDLKAGKTFSGKGKGKAKVRANSFLFEFTPRGDLAFDRTTVGVATEKAIGKAVQKMMKGAKL